MSIEEAIAKMQKAEQEREIKRREMEQLILSLLAYDSNDLGDAVKCYISGNADSAQMSDTALDAYNIIAKIKVLEWEC